MKKQLQLIFAALLIGCSFNLLAGVTKWEDFSLVNGTIRLPGAVDGNPGWVISTPAEGQKAHVLSQFEERHSRIRGRKVVGILGYDVLKHFVLTVDYKRGFGHIAPPST